MLPCCLCDCRAAHLLTHPLRLRHSLMPSTPPNPPCCSLSAISQLVLVATCTIHNAGVCRALALAHPAAHQATRGLFRALDCAAMAVSLPIALPNLRADVDGACGAVLTWLGCC